jgi:hypothetical protein
LVVFAVGADAGQVGAASENDGEVRISGLERHRAKGIYTVNNKGHASSQTGQNAECTQHPKSIEID